MWNDVNDFELAEIAGRYGLEDSLIFCVDLTLANRDEIEHLLALYEFDTAFPALYNNSEVEYN